MKILNWMQRKNNGRHGCQKPNSISPNYHHMQQETCKEEFSEWPDGLLAIGTFGNNNLKEDDPDRSNLLGNQSCEEDNPQDLDWKELLTSLLEKQVEPNSEVESETISLTFENFLNCPSSLEVDRTGNEVYSDESNDKTCHSRGKDVCLDITNRIIGKKSVSFLLKNMFFCKSGFTTPPSLRDPLSESKMQKILRAMLNKKRYLQNSGPTLHMKKHLEHRHSTKCANEDEVNEKADKGSKWVKTDSEYIVLEI